MLGKPMPWILSAILSGSMSMGCQLEEVPEPSGAQSHLEQSDTTRAHIGFGSALAETDIAKLVERHSVVSEAVYMWTTGLTGTYRTYEPMTIDKLLSAARANTIASFEKSLRSLAVRAQTFITAHSSAELTEDDNLATQAQSLLNLAFQLESALGTARAGKALVYSIEVEGTADSLESLRMDPVVRAFASVSTSSSRVAEDSMRAVKPAAYNVSYESTVISHLSKSQLHAVLAEFAAKYEEVEQ